MCLSVPIPRISLIVPLVDWVKAFARAALDVIVEFIADAGRFASEVSLSTKELGSRHAAVLCSALVVAPDDLYLLKSRAPGLYNHVNSTVAHWKSDVNSICLWFVRKVISIAASPFIALRATSRRGHFDRQLSLWTRLPRLLWKNPRFGSLVDCLDRHAHAFHRAFFVTAIILSLVLSDLTLFKFNVHIHCHSDSPHSSTPSVSSLFLYQEAFIEEDSFSEENTLIEQDAFILGDETFDPAKSAAADKVCQWASGFSWADDVEEEEAKQGEAVYFFPRKEARACQTLYSVPEEVEDEAEEKVFYFEAFEEKVEQSSENDSDDTTLCEIDPLLSGPLQENEEEFIIHENEIVLDSAQKEQHDEITLAVASSVSDTVLFEDENNINVKLPVVSSIGSSLRSNAPVFVQEESLVLTTWTPDLGLLVVASRLSEMGLFEGDNDIIVKLPVTPSASAPRRPSLPQSRTL